MLADDRVRRVHALVLKKGAISVSDLAHTLDVSQATIRRDLGVLAKQGAVRRVRGGASDPNMRIGGIRPEADSDAFDVVARQDSDAKRAIARRAVDLIADGDVIALDIGTTVFGMCEYLAERRLTVVTTSLPVVRALEDAPGIDLMVMGGILRPTYQSLVGVLTESCLRQVRVDKAFVGASGIRRDGAVLDSTPSEVPVKRALIEISEQVWLLAGQAKFPGTGVLQVAPIGSFTGLITDREPSQDELMIPEDEMVEVLVP